MHLHISPEAQLPAFHSVSAFQGEPEEQSSQSDALSKGKVSGWTALGLLLVCMHDYGCCATTGPVARGVFPEILVVRLTTGGS